MQPNNGQEDMIPQLPEESDLDDPVRNDNTHDSVREDSRDTLSERHHVPSQRISHEISASSD